MNKRQAIKYKLLTLIVVSSLFVIMTGKFWAGYSAGNNYLYVYGVAITIVVLTQFYVAFAKYKDPYLLSKIIPKKEKRKYLVSSLVAVRNEEGNIEKCVNSFLDQTYPKQEIIFIDDASTDSTPAVLDRYANQNLIKVIHLPTNLGKKKALAKGMLMAKGDIFAFSDSDCVLAKNAIKRVVGVFCTDPLVGAVSGHTRALNANKNLITKTQDSWYEGQFSIRKAFESYYGAVSCVSGPLAVFRKEAIYNFIPAWEYDTFLGQEFRFATDRTLTGFVLGGKTIEKRLKQKYADSEFVKRINYPAKNWRVVYCKSAKVWTNVPDTFKKVIIQQIRWKKSFIRNIFFTGKFYWRKPFVTALCYYLHILFVLAGPLIAARHLIYLPLKGNIFSAFLYIAGIVYIGFMFGLAYKIESNKSSKWMYRPLMSLLSTLVFSWLIFYSALTIKKMVWQRG